MKLYANHVSVEKPKVTGGEDIIMDSNEGEFVAGQTPKAMTVRVTIDFVSSGNCQPLVDNPELIMKAIFERYGTVVFEPSMNQNT